MSIYFSVNNEILYSIIQIYLICLISFPSPMVMICIAHHLVIEKHGWLQFFEFMAHRWLGLVLMDLVFVGWRGADNIGHVIDLTGHIQHASRHVCLATVPARFDHSLLFLLGELTWRRESLRIVHGGVSMGVWLLILHCGLLKHEWMVRECKLLCVWERANIIIAKRIVKYLLVVIWTYRHASLWLLVIHGQIVAFFHIV